MIEIRRCTVADFERILPLLRQLWPGKELNVGALRQVFLQGVQSPAQMYSCAEAGSTMAGFGSLVVKNNLWQAGTLGHIDELVVEATYRGQGIGTRLLGHILQIAKDRGCGRVELDTTFDRKEAHQFYERMGFENRAYLFSQISLCSSCHYDLFE